MKVQNLGIEIQNSIQERSRINAYFFNIKECIKSVNTWQAILKQNAAGLSHDKVNRLINKDIDECVQLLAEIEPLCKKYHELFYKSFEELKQAVHKKAKAQPLTLTQSLTTII